MVVCYSQQVSWVIKHPMVRLQIRHQLCKTEILLVYFLEKKIQRSLPSPCQHRLIQTNFFLAEHIQSQSTFWYLVPQIVNFQVINIISSTTHNSCTVSSNVIVTVKKVLHKSFVFLIKLLLLFYPSLRQDIFFAAAAVSFHRTGNKICTY